MTPGTEIDKITAVIRDLLRVDVHRVGLLPDPEGLFGVYVAYAMRAYDEHHALLAENNMLRRVWPLASARDALLEAERANPTPVYVGPPLPKWSISPEDAATLVRRKK